MESKTETWEEVDINVLNIDPANLRTHDRRNLDAIRASLARFGQQHPIVVDEKNVVVAGNGRLAAARELGWKTIRIVRTSLKGVDRAAFSIADNRSAELAGWDEKALLQTLREMRDEDAEAVLAAGWTDPELVNLTNRVTGFEAEMTSEPPIPDPPETADTKPGDVYFLGPHRLMCGDSSCQEDVAALTKGLNIAMVNTDPPYNVAISSRSARAMAAGLSSFGTDKPGQSASAQLRPKDRPIANDEMKPEDYAKVLRAWLSNIAMVLAPGGAFYIWGGYSNIENYPPAMRECGLHFSQTIIWVKEHPVMGRKDFMGNHEWGFYGWREGAAHRFFGAKNVPDTWHVKKVAPQKMVHLTEKPIELAARAIGFSSLPDEVVLDLFGGSGFTLMAAEQLGRRSCTMEMDPLYCDVIVARWETFTGRKAERQRSERPSA